MVEECFAEGFRQGFRAIRGATAPFPPTPPVPPLKPGRTFFQMGLIRGIERGKGWDRGHLMDLP